MNLPKDVVKLLIDYSKVNIKAMVHSLDSPIESKTKLEESLNKFPIRC